MTGLDSFLHSEDSRQRSQELIKFETHLKEELMGEFAEVLLKLVNQYQIVTTTHSPFIVTPKAIDGCRRIQKKMMVRNQ